MRAGCEWSPGYRGETPAIVAGRGYCQWKANGDRPSLRPLMERAGHARQWQSLGTAEQKLLSPPTTCCLGIGIQKPNTFFLGNTSELSLP